MQIPTTKFCNVCSIVKLTYCTENLLPSVDFIDSEKLKSPRGHICDLIYDNSNKIIYIEHKYIFYFCRYMGTDGVPQDDWESFKEDIKAKVDETIRIYESIVPPPSHANRQFILCISKNLPLPEINSTILKQNEIVAQLIPRAMILTLKTVLMSMKGAVGSAYYFEGKKINMMVDECINISKYI